MNHPKEKTTRITYSTVMADLLHYGHLRILQIAKDSGDIHICGLLSDEVCQNWWGWNICTFEERKAVLQNMSCVDRVLMQNSIDPTENLQLIRQEFPNSKFVFIHGNDWSQVPGLEYIKRNKIEVIQPKYYDRLSRENIIRSLSDGKVGSSEKKESYISDYLIGEITSFNSSGRSDILSNKADTLVRLSKILKNSKIEKMFVFFVKDYIDQESNVINSIMETFPSTTLIVRSSTNKEDQIDGSNAGKFDSVLNVNSEDNKNLQDAIDQVIKSYKKHDLDLSHEKILIQEQSPEVTISGVIFTRDLRTNSQYYLVNYDDESGETDTVTGGYIGKNVRLFRGVDINECPIIWRPLIEAVREIEQIIPGMVLDIEFGVDNQDRVIIYQVRPLASNVKLQKPTYSEFKSLLDDQIQKYNNINPKSDGQTILLSDMAFWNPSELIGDNPRMLEYSLLRKLITEKSWNLGLLPLGYSKVEEDLMIQIGNKPYIRLDCVFEALIPSQVEKRLREKLIQFYSNKILNDVSSHDKIEFDILISCWDFDCGNRIGELRNAGFKSKDLKDFENILIDLTRKCISGYESHLSRLNKDITKLIATTNMVSKSMQKTDDIWNLAKMFNTLIEEITLHGTPQFSSVARMAFMSKAICDSLITIKYFKEADINLFYNSIRTVASEFRQDFILFKNDKLSKNLFLDKYGHLRSGTFNIMAPTYRDISFGSFELEDSPYSTNEINNNVLTQESISNFIKDCPFQDISDKQLFNFLRSSIEKRELFKFQFSKPLSLSLEILAKIGNLAGFSREQISYLDVNLVEMLTFSHSKEDFLKFIDMNTSYNQKLYEDNSNLVLPPFIKGEMDIKIVNLGDSRPNFVTKKVVRSPIYYLTNHNTNVDLNNKIVMIDNADPGYDWIFTYNICGLITKYGGVASHMAIRSAEFNIPAAIGCGVHIFDKILAWKNIELDCASNRILPFV